MLSSSLSTLIRRQRSSNSNSSIISNTITQTTALFSSLSCNSTASILQRHVSPFTRAAAATATTASATAVAHRSFATITATATAAAALKKKKRKTGSSKARSSASAVTVAASTDELADNSTTAAELAHKIIRYKPMTPGRRHLVTVDRSELWKGAPHRSLVYGRTKSGGRNNTGRITVRHVGGGHRQKQRTIDFARARCDDPCVVQRLEYDPTRTAYIALVLYPSDSELKYILAPHDLTVGDTLVSSRSRELPLKCGNAMTLAYMPVGTVMHNLELVPRGGGQFARSAGSYCQLIGKDVKPGYCLVAMASKEQRLMLSECMATVGSREFMQQQQQQQQQHQQQQQMQ